MSALAALPRSPLWLAAGRGALFDPAVWLVLLIGGGLWLAGRKAPAASRSRRAGRLLAWAGWGLLWALSTPCLSAALVRARQPPDVDVDAALAGVDPARIALVVLAGGPRTNDLSVPPSERIDGTTQARVIAAARVYHLHDPGAVIASGGPPAVTAGMEALLRALGVPGDRIHLEPDSTSTRESAASCAPILRSLGAERVVLVTSVLHQRRAVADFAREGVTVIPARADVAAYVHRGWLYRVGDFFPTSAGLSRSHAALHELIGSLAP